MYKISIDVGTTNVKCALFSKNLTAIAEASKEYRLIHSNGNWLQQKATDWWQAVVECIQTVLKESNVNSKDIKAIGVSGQSPTFLLVDEAGEPVYDSIIWMDRRTELECEEIAQRIDRERIFEITGNQLDAYYLPSKFLWFRKNYPDLYRKGYKLLTSNGFINHKLTGNFSYDRSNASVSLLYDIHNHVWSKEILDVLDISEDLLPPIYESTEVIGYTNESIFEETGLVAGIPVIAGTADALAASIEAGVVSGGRAFEATGTSSVFSVAFDKVHTSPYLSACVGLNSETGSLFGPMSTSGGSYKWCRDVLINGGKDGTFNYNDMEQLIDQDAPNPTDIIFLPYMAGERSPIWNSDARGVFFGLSLGSKRGHMLRAVMEGTSFALRDNIETARKAGVDVTSISSVGGCTNSDYWLKIKASIINMPIEIPSVSFGAAAGLALMMTPTTGEYSTVQEAVDTCVKVERTIYPVPEWVDYYEQMYQSFKSIYNHTLEDFSALSKLNSKKLSLSEVGQ